MHLNKPSFFVQIIHGSILRLYRDNLPQLTDERALGLLNKTNLIHPFSYQGRIRNYQTVLRYYLRHHRRSHRPLLFKIL